MKQPKSDLEVCYNTLKGLMHTNVIEDDEQVQLIIFACEVIASKYNNKLIKLDKSEISLVEKTKNVKSLLTGKYIE